MNGPDFRIKSFWRDESQVEEKAYEEAEEEEEEDEVQVQVILICSRAPTVAIIAFPL